MKLRQSCRKHSTLKAADCIVTLRIACRRQMHMRNTQHKLMQHPYRKRLTHHVHNSQIQICSKQKLTKSSFVNAAGNTAPSKLEIQFLYCEKIKK
jgi:hypothetical protein